MTAALLGVSIVAAAISVIGLAVHRLNGIEGLPETAKRVSWLAVAYAVLGGAICATALLASHVEHLCGARVWRSRHRFYFAR